MSWESHGQENTAPDEKSCCNSQSGGPPQPPFPTEGTERKTEGWEPGEPGGAGQLRAGPRQTPTALPQPPAAASCHGPCEAKIKRVNYLMLMSNWRKNGLEWAVLAERLTHKKIPTNKQTNKKYKPNPYSTKTFRLWLTAIRPKPKAHFSWGQQTACSVLQNNLYNSLRGEKKKKVEQACSLGDPKDRVSLSLPPSHIICSCFTSRVAHCFSAPGSSPLCAKGCPVTQPLRKLFPATQWQLVTSKPPLNTGVIKAQQSEEQTLCLSQSTLK